MAPETTHSPPRGARDAHAETEPGVTLDPTQVDTRTATRRTKSSATRHVRLDRLERTILQARIAALERALDAKDRERTAIIDQYETILAARERDRDDAVTIEFEDTETDRGLLGRLRTLLR
ncbi:MAG: hypothetical protein ABEI77_04955 [Halorientalis sp.]